MGITTANHLILLYNERKFANNFNTLTRVRYNDPLKNDLEHACQFCSCDAAIVASNTFRTSLACAHMRHAHNPHIPHRTAPRRATSRTHAITNAHTHAVYVLKGLDA